MLFYYFGSAFGYDFAEECHFLMFHIKRCYLCAVFIDTSHVIKNSGILSYNSVRKIKSKFEWIVCRLVTQRSRPE